MRVESFRMNPLPLIVTAYYDIGRGQWQHFQRGSDRYFERFERLCLMHNDIVVYTHPTLRERFEALQRRKPNLTVIYDDIFERHAGLLERIRAVQQDPEFRAGIGPIESAEYNSAEYVLINALKSEFCCQAIDSGRFSHEQVAWIDFGYLRKARQIARSRRWESPWPDGIHFFSLRSLAPPIDLLRTIQTNTVYIQGCHLVAHRREWAFVREGLMGALESLLARGWVDDDQTLLLMLALQHPDRVTVHPVALERRLDWFVLFRRFNPAEARATVADRLGLLAGLAAHQWRRARRKLGS